MYRILLLQIHVRFVNYEGCQQLDPSDISHRSFEYLYNVKLCVD